MRVSRFAIDTVVSVWGAGVTVGLRCHEGATESIPDARMSHYEPSWSRTPLVYAVTLGYKFLIPFMIGGLILQILLHIWRVVVNR